MGMRTFFGRRARVWLSGIAIAVLGAGWIGWAQVGSSGVIFGCLSPSGFIRGIDETSGSCHKTDTALSWYTKEGVDGKFLGRAAKAADADTLDGLDSSHFAVIGHLHDDRYLTQAAADGRYLARAGKAADSDLLDGLDSSQFITAAQFQTLTVRVEALESLGGGPAEECADGIDNNGNGLIDCGDPACASNVVCSLPPVDVLFLLDTTADMNGALANLRSGIQNVSAQIRAQNADTAFGVAEFRDYPTPPFGDPGDQPYRLALPMTSDQTALLQAISTLAAAGGGDLLESGHEALYQAAAPGGGVGFRPGARHLILVITSAMFHEALDYPFASHGAAQALAELSIIGAKVAGVSVGAGARATLEDYAAQTGAVVASSVFSLGGACGTGLNGAAVPPSPDGTCPLVFEVAPDGAGLVSAATSALQLVP